ncbi:MAG: serine/threonine protein kinase [Planctomycetota bacterium]|nr:MAG: serine/threonine protein kinase [Planctomycetota bacterium]
MLDAGDRPIYDGRRQPDDRISIGFRRVLVLRQATRMSTGTERRPERVTRSVARRFAPIGGERGGALDDHHGPGGPVDRRAALRTMGAVLAGAFGGRHLGGSLLAADPAPDDAPANGARAAGDPFAPPGRCSWPSFRNGNELRGVAGCPLPERLELLWKAPAQDGMVSAAAIVAGHVYAPVLGGRLYCLDRRTGKPVWEYQSLENPKPNAFLPGFQSAPTVTADSVFLGDEDGVFHAVDRRTGKRKWTFQTQAEIIASAAVVGERVIFGSYDSHLYCLEAKTGALVWKLQTGDRINGSPAVSQGVCFVTGCDEHLHVVDVATGAERYKMPIETYLIASPAVYGDVLYFGTYTGEVLAVNWKEKKVVWRYRDPEKEFPIHSSAAVTGAFVVVGSRDKRIHCIDRRTGKRVWIVPTRGRVDSSPVVVGDRVYVGSSDGNLYGLELATGKVVWKFAAGRAISASPAVGEGCLVIGTESADGQIFCFGSSDAAGT